MRIQVFSEDSLVAIDLVDLLAEAHPRARVDMVGSTAALHIPKKGEAAILVTHGSGEMVLASSDVSAFAAKGGRVVAVDDAEALAPLRDRGYAALPRPVRDEELLAAVAFDAEPQVEEAVARHSAAPRSARSRP